MTTSDCVDEVGCDRSGCESGGGGGGWDDVGSGDGVGEWSRVMGLSKVCCGLSSGVMSTSGGVVVGRSAWGSGSIGSMVNCTCPITSPSWSDQVKVDVRCENTLGCALLPI